MEKIEKINMKESKRKRMLYEILKRVGVSEEAWKEAVKAYMEEEVRRSYEEAKGREEKKEEAKKTSAKGKGKKASEAKVSEEENTSEPKVSEAKPMEVETKKTSAKGKGKKASEEKKEEDWREVAQPEWLGWGEECAAEVGAVGNDCGEP